MGPLGDRQRPADGSPRPGRAGSISWSNPARLWRSRATSGWSMPSSSFDHGPGPIDRAARLPDPSLMREGARARLLRLRTAGRTIGTGPPADIGQTAHELIGELSRQLGRTRPRRSRRPPRPPALISSEVGARTSFARWKRSTRLGRAARASSIGYFGHPDRSAAASTSRLRRGLRDEVLLELQPDHEPRVQVGGDVHERLAEVGGQPPDLAEPEFGEDFAPDGEDRQQIAAVFLGDGRGESRDRDGPRLDRSRVVRGDTGRPETGSPEREARRGDKAPARGARPRRAGGPPRRGRTPSGIRHARSPAAPPGPDRQHEPPRRRSSPDRSSRDHSVPPATFPPSDALSRPWALRMSTTSGWTPNHRSPLNSCTARAFRSEYSTGSGTS